LANKIADTIKNKLPKEIKKVEVAGPGFINFYLSDEFFIEKIKEILKSKEIHLALLDIMLPKKNGIEVLKELRTFSELPVIMLTAVTDEDISRVINAAQAISIPANKEIIHVIPKNYSLDDQKDIKDPLGMNGVRLEVDAMIIEGSSPFIKNLAKCLEQTKIDLDDFILSPLAAAKATLTKRQKELGVVLVDIGGGTTSLVVFEENEILHAAVLPVGGSHITNDIAIGLRTSIDVAEKVKLEFGSALPREIGKKEDINLSEIEPNEEGIVSRQHVAEIIEARLEEIFSLVNKELKSIGREKLLPAGVVLTGGTAKIPGAVDLAKNVMALPAQTGFPMQLGGLIDKVDDPSFVTSVGLVLWGLENSFFFKEILFRKIKLWATSRAALAERLAI
jgi:cell division protein FtsA